MLSPVVALVQLCVTIFSFRGASLQGETEATIRGEGELHLSESCVLLTIGPSRYAVSNMDYGWTLHTVTAVRENKDCRGWFMNSAVDFCHLPEEPDDLGIGAVLCWDFL